MSQELLRSGLASRWSVRGSCPRCGFRFALRKDGRVRVHIIPEARDIHPIQKRCPGSGMEPEPERD